MDRQGGLCPLSSLLLLLFSPSEVPADAADLSLSFPRPVLSGGGGKLILAMPGEFVSQVVVAAANMSPSLLESQPLNTSQEAIVSCDFPCCLQGLVYLGIKGVCSVLVICTCVCSCWQYCSGNHECCPLPTPRNRFIEDLIT